MMDLLLQTVLVLPQKEFQFHFLLLHFEKGEVLALLVGLVGRVNRCPCFFHAWRNGVVRQSSRVPFAFGIFPTN